MSTDHVDVTGDRAATGILRGVRVVDCSEGLAGPVATLLLAEAGADVVKVERPGGDPGRDGGAFRTFNRSKRSVVADLDAPSGRADLDRLLASADVLVHDWGPGWAAERRLGDGELRARHPRLTTCAVRAWPLGHPDADERPDDLLVSARLGLLDEQRGVRDGPIFLRFPVGSWCAGYLAAIGVMGRLIRRDRGGPPGPVNTSIAQGALLPTMMHWARAETPGPSFAFGLPKDLAPSLFECADGVWIHLMAGPDQASPLMAKLLHEMGAEAVAQANRDCPVISTPNYPNFGANRVAFLSRPSAEWLEDFWAHDIPAQPAAPFGSLLGDEQARVNGYVTDLVDPEWGTVTQAGTPFSTTPPSRVRRAAPACGEHTEEVLAALPGPPPAAPTHPVGGTGAAGAAEPPLLAGLRVLDFGSFLAGPLAPMLLADLGADVVKVEGLTGDKMRGVERAFASCQRGKRSVALDLKSPAARPALEALVQWADVVHHNMRMPAARRLGLDHESLRAVNPELVYCHASSYGPRGARADWPGYDQLFQACGGWEVLGAGEGNPPMWFRFGFMDHLCALASAMATLLAVYHRDRTGDGQAVTASLLGAAALTNGETFLKDGRLAVPPPAVTADQTGLSPGHRIYRLDDGWLALAARDDAELAVVCRALGAAHPQGLADRLASCRRAEVAEELGRLGVATAPVRTDQGDAFLDDPVNRQIGLVASYDHGTWGRLEQVGAFWQLGDSGLCLHEAPPLLGQHTEEVLQQAGVGDHQIHQLLADGVLGRS